MPKIIMTKGLPGSGKTTWAFEYLEKDPNTVLVCKDDLRAMMFNSAHTGKREGFVLGVRDFIVSEALKKGRNVIVHDTNFNPIHEKRLRALSVQYKSDFIIQDFTSTPIEVCIKQDLLRPDSVGERVIRDMYNDWIKPKPPVILYDPSLPDAIICDLDGTLCLAQEGADPYDRDFLADIVNQPVRKTLLSLGKPGVEIIFISGRKDKFKEQTDKWLNDHWGPNYKLFMRKTLPDGVKDPKDSIVKAEIYEAEIKGKYNVILVLDDRNQVVEFWRSLGLTVFQVADGDF